MTYTAKAALSIPRRTPRRLRPARPTEVARQQRWPHPGLGDVAHHRTRRGHRRPRTGLVRVDRHRGRDPVDYVAVDWAVVALTVAALAVTALAGWLAWRWSRRRDPAALSSRRTTAIVWST